LLVSSYFQRDRRNSPRVVQRGKLAAPGEAAQGRPTA